MIDFPCGRCHHLLSVPQELAGDDIQCPDCGLLNSIPFEDEPVHADGTLHVKAVNRVEDPDRLATLASVFGTRSIDGDEADNRGDPDILDLAPLPSTPKPIPLQYDPETGEIVTALEILPPIASPAPPGTSSTADYVPPALAYATPGKTPAGDIHGIWIRLFDPANAAVMCIIFIAHLLYGAFYPFLVLMLATLEDQGLGHVPAWIFNLIFWLVAAHYANVVEDTGPEERDQLPRPLRHLAFIDDIVAPLFRIVCAFVICYLPAIISLNLPMNPITRSLAIVALVGGGMLFPALLLTLAGGRAIANLRPDRVARVIIKSGFAYWPIAMLAAVCVPVYLLEIASIDLITPLLEDTDVMPYYEKFANKSFITLPLAMGAIYAMHGICWRLGQFFRKNGIHFGWVWEELEAERDEERRRRHEAQQRAAARRRKNAQSARPPAAPPPKRLVMESLQAREHM